MAKHDDHAYRVRNLPRPRMLNYSSEGEQNSAPSPLYESNSDHERSPATQQQDELYKRSEEYVVETGERSQIKEEVEEMTVVECTPPREVILEDTESQDGNPVGIIVGGLFTDIVEDVILRQGNQEAAQQSPPRHGRLVYAEEIRNTPARDRRGPTRDERRAAQDEYPVGERIGTNPPAYARPGTSRTSDSREPKKKKKQSREARDSADPKGRKSLHRDAKKPVTYTENDGNKLEGQIKDESGTYSFPTSYHDTTATDINSETDSEFEEEYRAKRN